MKIQFFSLLLSIIFSTINLALAMDDRDNIPVHSSKIMISEELNNSSVSAMYTAHEDGSFIFCESETNIALRKAINKLILPSSKAVVPGVEIIERGNPNEFCYNYAFDRIFEKHNKITPWFFTRGILNNEDIETEFRPTTEQQTRQLSLLLP